MYTAILEVVELINVHTFALSLDILCQPTGPAIQIKMMTTFQPLQQSMAADCQKSDRHTQPKKSQYSTKIATTTATV